MADKITKIELGILFFLALWFQFNAVNVNPVLGQIYTGFAILAAVFIILDPNRQIRLKNPNNTWIGSIAKGAAAYIVLLLAGNYIIVPGVTKLLASTTPALATNPQINFITFGQAIPLAETIFLFAVSLDFLSSVFSIPIGRRDLTNLKTWALVFALSLVFMFFHLSSKGISSVPILVLVLFMAIISFVLIIWDQDYTSAIAMHIIANTLALTTFTIIK